MIFHLLPTTATTTTLIITVIIMVTVVLLPCRINCLCPARCTCADEKLSVNCKEASLDIIPFTLNPGTRELLLSSNQIKSIKESFTYYTQLTLLDLSSNQITSLHRKHFIHQRILQKLILSTNRISHLTNESFAGLESLRDLILADNQLTILMPRIFTGLTHLEKLDLSRNAITQITDEALSGLPELRTLILRSNQLSSPPSSAFHFIPNLVALDLGHNELNQLDEQGFLSLTHLTDLRLDLCSLNFLSTSWAHGLVNLKSLNLDGNNLPSLGPTLFKDLISLEELIIGANRFTTIGELTFHPLSASLKTLDIRYSRDLTSFHPKSLLGLNQLSSLIIEYCPKLKSLPGELLKDSSSSMRNLILRNNGLTSLPHNLLTSWPALKKLDLRDNPWTCNCSLLWLWKYLRKTVNNSTHSLNQFSDLICSSPLPLQGKPLTSLSMDQIDCYNPTSSIATLILGSSITGLIIVIILTLLIFWCRNRLPLILLRHKKFTNNLTEEFVYEKGRFMESQVIFPPTSSPYHPSQYHQQHPNQTTLPHHHLLQNQHHPPHPHKQPHLHQQQQHLFYNSTSSSPYYYRPGHHHPSSSLIIIQSPVKKDPISQV